MLWKCMDSQGICLTALLCAVLCCARCAAVVPCRGAGQAQAAAGGGKAAEAALAGVLAGPMGGGQTGLGLSLFACLRVHWDGRQVWLEPAACAANRWTGSLGAGCCLCRVIRWQAWHICVTLFASCFSRGRGRLCPSPLFAACCTVFTRSLTKYAFVQQNCCRLVGAAACPGMLNLLAGLCCLKFLSTLALAVVMPCVSTESDSWQPVSPSYSSTVLRQFRVSYMLI